MHIGTELVCCVVAILLFPEKHLCSEDLLKRANNNKKTAILVSADSVLEIGNIGPPGLIEC